MLRLSPGKIRFGSETSGFALSSAGSETLWLVAML
jgi:hypothetical protein